MDQTPNPRYEPRGASTAAICYVCSHVVAIDQAWRHRPGGRHLAVLFVKSRPQAIVLMSRFTQRPGTRQWVKLPNSLLGL
jgi:hypothetical protein